MKQFIKKYSKFVLVLLLTIIIIPLFFNTYRVYAENDAMPVLKVIPLGARYAPVYVNGQLDHYELRAYDDDGTHQIYFRILVTNFKEGDILTQDVTFSYRTYDLTAVGKSDRFSKDGTYDYIPVNDTAKFTKNTKVGSSGLYIDVPVSVYDCEYATFKTTDYSGSKFYDVYYDTSSTTNATYDKFSYGIDTSVTDENVVSAKQTVASSYFNSKTFNTQPTKTGYHGNYFGFEIYDVKNASVYNEANSADGTNIYYNSAKGAVPASSYLPIHYFNGNLQVAYWTSQVTLYTESIELKYWDNRANCVTKFNLENYAFADEVKENAIGLGNWYVSWGFSLYCGRTDSFTKYNYYTLSYDGFGDDLLIAASKKDNVNTNSDGGLLTAELSNDKDDTFIFGSMSESSGLVRINSSNTKNPIKETESFDEGAIHLSNWQHDGSTKSGYTDFSNEYYANMHSSYIQSSTDRKSDYYITNAFRIGGNPEYVSIYAAKSKEGGNRYLKNNTIFLFPTDATPPEIVDIYIEDTDYIQKTKDDVIRLYVKLSEPVHFTSNNTGDNKMKIYCKTDNGTQMVFEYSEGEGTDTLVFVYEFKNFEKEEIISKIIVESATNPSNLVDFSSVVKVYLRSSSGVEGNHAQKTDRRTWNLTDAYFGNEVVKATASEPQHIEIYKSCDLTKTIDTRAPAISDVIAPSAIIPSRTHTAKIELVQSDMEGKVYVYWTEDMNLLTSDKECIPDPVYTEVNSFDLEDGYVTTSASLHGVRYLWFKIVTDFNKVEERVCGPFYFDNEQDTVQNIKTTDAYGTETSNFTSPSKTKYIQFEVLHTYDYKSCAGQDLRDSDNNVIGLTNVVMLYSKDSTWGADTEYGQEVTLYMDSVPNVRGLYAIEETVTDYVYEFSYYSENLSGSMTKVTTGSFIAKNDDGSNKTKEYCTKRTYRVLIGYIEIDKGDDGLEVEYNDFDILEGEIDENFIGFIVNDGLNDLKDYDGTEPLTKNVEYNGSTALTISTIDIIQPTISYSLNGNPSYDALMNTKNYQKEIDSSIEAYILKNTETMQITLDFLDYDAIPVTGVQNGVYRFRIKVEKPHSSLGDYALKQVVESIGGGSETRIETFTDDTFTGIPYYDVSKDAETPWFTWKLAGQKTIAGESKYTQIVITMETPKDCADLSGYYTISFDLLNYTNVFTLESKTIRPFSFYIGNSTDDTVNVESINDGKLLINKVYRIDEGIKYYWFDTGYGIHEEYYSPVGTQLTFSSMSAAKEYLTYMERQDLDLYVIKSDNDAIALYQGSGEYYRAACDMDHVPAKNEVWIRYKSATWSVGNKEKSSWVYYYYTNVSTTTKINMGNLPDGLNEAIESVVNTILKGACASKDDASKTIMLTTKYGLDENGAPSLDADCIKPDNLSVLKTKTNVEYVSPLNYSGDKKIYNANVTISDGINRNSYMISSNTKLSFNNHNNVYISPCFGEYQGYYGKCSKSETATLKDYVNEIYTQISEMFGQGGGTTTAPSGVYKLMEIDDYGISYVYVYIDKTAPQINFSYNTWSTSPDGLITNVESIQHAIVSSSLDRTINATSMTITGLGKLGVFNGVNADEEVDNYAYIAVFDTSGTTLYTARLATELVSNPVVLDEDGTYRVQVYDRSGNNYELTINICTVEMAVTVYTDNNVMIKIENRDVSQIKEFEIKKDNVSIDTLFEDSKLYYLSGNYSIHIVDKFGITYNYTFRFSRNVPEIMWLVEDGTGFSAVNENSSLAYLTQKTEILYNVVTSQKVAFRFDAGDGIGLEFMKGCTKADFSITETSDTTYIQKEAKAFKVKFYYLEYPNVTITYNVIYDQEAPKINVGYDYYTFETNESIDMMFTLEQILANRGTLNNGEIISPTRLDYTLQNIQRIKISSGSVINTQKVFLDFSDESGVSTIKIDLNGVTLFEGNYQDSGIYYDEYGTLVGNYNVLDQYGEYKIYAYDRLGNVGFFQFENSSNYEIMYSVDGEEITPVYDYIYKLDAYGNAVVDENNQKIVESQWYYVTKFLSVDEDIVDSQYYIPKTEFNKSYVHYGNQAQVIRISQNAYIDYLITDSNTGENYYIGIQYENGELCLYRYYVEFGEIEGSTSFGVEKRINKTPVYSKEIALTELEKEIYCFEDLGLKIVATFTSNGNLELTLNASEDTSVIAICQTRVTSIEGVYEPAFFKTVLSKSATGVEVTNGYKIVNSGDIGINEWIYTNGDGLFVDTEHVSDYIKAIYLSYSNSMSTYDYKYLYSSDMTKFTEEDIINLWYGSGFEDGYYSIRVDNVFGNSKYYYFIFSNSLFVTTVATYEDGWEKEFSTKHTLEINCNGSVLVTFKEDNIKNVELIKDNVDAKVVKSNENGGWDYIFSDNGHYVLTITDEYGNVVVRDITIQKKTLTIPSDAIIGLNQNALKAKEKYSNTKGTINSYFFNTLNDESKVQYISITCGNYFEVLFDQISDFSERVELNEEKLQDCIGCVGDGIYVITFRDGYGNLKEETVHYRETSTLVLTRVTNSSQYEEVYSIEDALNTEINFISNKDLIFNTLSKECIFTVNGELFDLTKGSKVLSFTNTANEGRIPYVITYKDEYGFNYTFNAILYRTVLYVTAENTDAIESINNQNVVKDKFKISYSPNATCTYTLNGGAPQLYQAGNYVKLDGEYLFTVKDLAGNVAYYAITKDTIVYFSFNEGGMGSTIGNGFVTSSNQINFVSENKDEAFIKYAFINGEAVDVSQVIDYTQNGKWEFVIEDKYGNQVSFMFIHITHEINELDYYVPQNYEFVDIWLDTPYAGKITCNQEVLTDKEGRKHFQFSEEGTYSVIIRSKVTNEDYNFVIDISHSMPTAKLNGIEDGGTTIKDVEITNTVAGDTVYVYNGSKLVSTYSITYDNEKVTISDEGNFTVRVKNIAGNEVTYSFVKKHVANTAGSILIVTVLAIIIVGLFVSVVYRKCSKVDK